MKKPESKPLNDFLGMVDEAHPELQRTAIQIGTGDDGEPLGIIVWKARSERGGQHVKTPVSVEVQTHSRLAGKTLKRETSKRTRVGSGRSHCK